MRLHNDVYWVVRAEDEPVELFRALLKFSATEELPGFLKDYDLSPTQESHLERAAPYKRQRLDGDGAKQEPIEAEKYELLRLENANLRT